MAANSDASPDQSPEFPDQTGESKVVKRTFAEIREDARRTILSSSDRDRYEHLEPDEKEFVDKVCLYEEKSQKVSRSQKKIKLREIMLCRDVAQAYCPSKDAVSQYSEAKRIMLNSETGSDSVKFVLARKVCSMLDKIFNIYQGNPPSYVRGDLHKQETDLLNYINRLGRMIREPLSEARRVYNKLKERAGWDLPTAAFGMAEDCDVPQLFFSRYSSPAQLLLKDPEKPFRSDNTTPPLKLDFRIKNAVLIVAGENAFHLDKGRMDKVRDTSAVKFIEAKSIQEGKDKISKGYRRKNYQLAEGLTLKDDLSVDSIKEDAFRLFYNYTLKNLPHTASRGDVSELFILELMKEENDIGCKGFCRSLYPPEAVEDPNEPAAWTKKGTKAYKLRKLFQQVAKGKVRLSMFPTKMNEMLSEYLEGQLKKLKEQIAEPFAQRIKRAEADLNKFIEEHGSFIEQEQKDLETIENLEAERSKIIDEAFTLVAKTLQKNLKAETGGKKKKMLDLIKPKLVVEVGKKKEVLESLKKKYEGLSARKKKLDAYLAKAETLSKRLKENSNDQEAREQEKQLIASVTGNSGPQSVSPEALVNLIGERLNKVKTSLGDIKKHFDHHAAMKNRLNKMVSMIDQVDSHTREISRLRKKPEENSSLRQEEEKLREALNQLNSEYEDQVSQIEEALAVNSET